MILFFHGKATTQNGMYMVAFRAFPDCCLLNGSQTARNSTSYRNNDQCKQSLCPGYVLLARNVLLITDSYY